MKKADECKNIDEIRSCIDQIDKNILDQISLRSLYVAKAAQYKNSLSEVNASDRVKTMIDLRRKWAQEVNLNPDFIQSLFRQITGYFIKKETSEWLKDHDINNNLEISEAKTEDAKEILSIQKRAFLQEAELPGNNFNIKPLTQTLTEMEADFLKYTILKGCFEKRIIGSIRANMVNDTCYIGRLIVEPIFQHKGYGTIMLNAIESRFPQASTFELFTGESSKDNICFYTKRGYKIIGQIVSEEETKLIKMEKRVNQQT